MKLFNKKNLGKIITGVACFGVAFTTLYLVTNPRKVKKDNPNNESNVPVIPDVEDSYFDKFANRLIDKFTNPDSTLNFKAKLENLAFSSLEDKSNVYASISGELALSIDSFKNVEYTVDLDVSKGESDLLLAFGYVNKYSYFSLGDKGFKLAYTSIDEITNFCKEILSSVIDFDSGISSLDLSSLLSGINIESLMPQEIVNGDNVNFIINNDTVNLEISANKDTLDLTKINIKSLNISSISLSTLVSVEQIEKVRSFDDVSYVGRKISFSEAKVFSNIISVFNSFFATNKLGLNMNASIFRGGTTLIGIKTKFNSKLDDDLNPQADLDVFATISNSNAYAAANACFFDGYTYITIPTDNGDLKLKYNDENFNSIYELMIEIVSGFIGSGFNDIFNTSSKTIGTVSRAVNGNLISFDILSLINNSFENFNFTEDKLVINLLNDKDQLNLVLEAKENSGKIRFALESSNNDSILFDINISVTDFDSTNIAKVRGNEAEYNNFNFEVLRLVLRSINTKTYKLTSSLSLSIPSIISKTNVLLDLKIDVYIDYSSGYLKILIENDNHVYWPIVMSYGVINSKIGYDGETGLVHILNKVQELDAFTGFPFGDIYDLYYVTEFSNFIGNFEEYFLKDLFCFTPEFADEIISASDTKKASSRGINSVSYNLFQSIFSFTYSYDENTKEDILSSNFNLSAFLGISLFDDAEITLYGKREDADSNFLSKFTLSTKLLKIITITSTTVIDNESQDQGEKIDNLFNVYNNLTDEEKVIFDESYLNNPESGWKIQE